MIPDFVARLRDSVGSEELLWLPGVSGVVLDRGRVLLVRGVDGETWTIVNGILEPGEDPAAGLVREIREETAIGARVECLTSLTVSPAVRHGNGDRAQYLEMTFRCSPVSGSARVNDDENHEVAWFSLDALPPLEERVRERIRRAVESEGATWFEAAQPNGAGPSDVEPSVTVVTPTRGRPELVAATLDVVRRQRGGHVARHLFVVDACSATAAELDRLLADAPRSVSPGHQVDYTLVPREEGETSGPERLGRLRDLAATLVQTPWLAYLDDDNDWEPDHLHTLVSEGRASGAPAVHSWRRLFNPDGTPYLEPLFPWGADEEEMAHEYRRHVMLGLLRPGSPIFCDDASTEVDGGSWLLDTDLVRRLGFACELDDHDRLHRIGEDDKFLARLHEEGVAIACSRRPTLRYSLGGDSNLRLRAT